MKRATLAALVILVGCGGDEGGDPQVYEKAGAAICSDYATAIGELGQPTQADEIGAYIAQALPVLTRAVERIEKLDPPSERRDEFEAFRSAARQTVDRATALRAAAEAADADRVQGLLAEATRAREPRAQLARSAGLEACADL